MSQYVPISEIVAKSPIKVTAGQIRKWLERRLGLISKKVNGRNYIRFDDYMRFINQRSL